MKPWFLLCGLSLIYPLSAQTNSAPVGPTQNDFDRITQSNHELLELLKKQQSVLEDIQHDRTEQSRHIAELESRLDEALQRNTELQSEISKLQIGGTIPAPSPSTNTVAEAPQITTNTAPHDTPSPSDSTPDSLPPSTAASFLPPQLPEGPKGEKWWHRLFVLTGSDSQTTPLFHVQGKGWRVVWHNLDKPGKIYENTSALFINAFPKNDTIPQPVCSKVGAGGDTVLLNGPGNFYLKIESSGGTWALAVEDFVADPQ